jgi:hypothetical protein
LYAKPPFGGPQQVLKYLARYTHRVAISNYRLVMRRLPKSSGNLNTRRNGMGGISSPWINSFRPPSCVVTAVIYCSGCHCRFVNGLALNAMFITNAMEMPQQ